MENFLKVLRDDKFKIGRTAQHIPMDVFLSFLTVDTNRSHDHLGRDTGWTKLTGDNGLIISGGIYGGVEYLDSIQYGKNLASIYNNYVNPFYIFDIMNEAGKKFFIKYYKQDIMDVMAQSRAKAAQAAKKAEQILHESNKICAFWSEIIG